MKLKRGGIVRICVPDLEKAVSCYLKDNKEEFLNFFYSTNKKDYFGHLYMYDFELLKKLLNEAGFANIVRCKAKEGKMPDINTLDFRPDEKSVYVEAEKI